MASVEPSAAMAVSDDPGGTAPITHVYDAWLSVAWPARAAGAAPAVRVPATTMAAQSILFIASSPRRRPAIRADTKMYPIDGYPTEGHIPSVAALPSRVRARPRAVQGCAVPAAAQKTRAGM